MKKRLVPQTVWILLLLPLAPSEAGSAQFLGQQSMAVDRLFRLPNGEQDRVERLAPGIPNSFPALAHATEARLSRIPWADRMWDHNRALLLERYSDARFNRLGSWPQRRSYLQDWSSARALRLTPGPERERVIGTLSPAEKYDLLLGVERGGLADHMTTSLNKDMGADQRFPNWWGICEGSAAASLTEMEPVNPVTVVSEANGGLEISFSALDIKGLVSLLWSSYNYELRVPEIGQQCRSRAPGGSPWDQQDPACMDVNPASLHRALVHFLYQGNGALIADVDETSHVWNHPLVGYSLFFYRPDIRPARSTQWEQSLIRLADWPEDPRRSQRAPGTVYVIGVVNKIIYGESPKDTPANGSRARTLKDLLVQYELELDSEMRLIGGAWLTKKHPDILWTIPKGTMARSPGDSLLPQGIWNGNSLRSGLDLAAQRGGMVPLKAVVQRLLELSAQ
jgi:hypothetical protein